jgi:hypothetical protein
MAIIYLRHPVHGSKIASMEAEATYDESNGWKRFDPNEAPEALPDPAVNVLAAIVVEPDVELEPDAADLPVRRRRARQE